MTNLQDCISVCDSIVADDHIPGDEARNGARNNDLQLGSFILKCSRSRTSRHTWSSSEA